VAALSEVAAVNWKILLMSHGGYGIAADLAALRLRLNKTV
jgi:hypothetical protein